VPNQCFTARYHREGCVEKARALIASNYGAQLQLTLIRLCDNGSKMGDIIGGLFGKSRAKLRLTYKTTQASLELRAELYATILYLFVVVEIR